MNVEGRTKIYQYQNKFIILLSIESKVITYTSSSSHSGQKADKHNWSLTNGTRAQHSWSNYSGVVTVPSASPFSMLLAEFQCPKKMNAAYEAIIWN